MKALLGKINGDRSIEGKPPIGIGIHTDEVIVGNMGSKKRLDYTVIGDGVALLTTFVRNERTANFLSTGR